MITYHGKMYVLDEVDLSPYSTENLRKVLKDLNEQAIDETGRGIDLCIVDHINLFKFVGLFLIAFLLIYCVAYEYINAYVLRFAEDIGGSLASITTGRTEIWEKYIDKIFSDPVIFLFGAGVNSKVGDLGTHNTYLDCFYSFVVIGTILFILLLKKSFIDVIELKMIWVPISILLIRMIAIGILSYDNLWFYLILLLTIGKSCNIAKETQLNKS